MVGELVQRLVMTVIHSVEMDALVPALKNSATCALVVHQQLLILVPPFVETEDGLDQKHVTIATPSTEMAAQALA